MIGLLISVIGSCKNDITDLNINPKSPINADPAHLYSYAQFNLARQIGNYDYNHNVAVFWANYATQTTYIQESSYNAADRDIGGNIFDNIYTETLLEMKTAREAVESADVPSTETAIKKNKLAIIDILEVYCYQYLVDNFGDVPYTEALDPENVTPKYDDDQAIYDAIIAKLESAYSSIDTGAGVGSFAAADVIYKGDLKHWEKFAHTLNLKLAIRISDVNPTKATKMINASKNKIFDSADDNALFTYVGSEPYWNPVYDYFVWDSRNSDFVATENFLTLLNSLNDPRVDIYYDDNLTGAKKGGVYGANGNSYATLTHLNPDWTDDPKRPTNILDYSLAMFDMAEAVAKGLVSGNPKDFYDKGVKASFAHYGIAETIADTYLAANPYDAANWKNSIGIQKYIASTINPHEGWTEARRIGVPALSKAASNNVENPKRMIYPIDEPLINESNYDAASSNMGGDKTTSAIFWDK